MNATDLERLFWEELDEPESGRLEQIERLSRDQPEMRDELEQLRALAAELDAVKEVAPPPELRLEVRRRVAERPAYGQAGRTTLVGWMSQTLAIGWQARLAYATLGALIGALAAHLFVAGVSPMSEAERSRLSGAINVTAADPQPLEIPLASSAGTLRFDRQGTSLVATLTPTPGTTLELSLDRGDGRIEPLRVERIQATRHEITARPGAVRLVADGAVSLVLEIGGDGPSTLAARVKSATGETVLDRRLDLARLTGGDR